MVTLDCPACGKQLHIASEQLVRTGRYRAQEPPSPASAQSSCVPPLYHTAARSVLLQGISFWEYMRAIFMLLFLLACLFAIAVAVVMDFEAITVPDAKKAPTLQLPNDFSRPDVILNVDAARDILLNA